MNIPQVTPFSEIRYHDFVLMLTALDAEWTRSEFSEEIEDVCHGYPSSLQKSLAEMDSAITSYADEVERNFSHWRKANGMQPAQKDELIDSKLFSMQPWIPYGHANALSLCLLDDMDAAQAIAEKYPNTIEEVTLGYCPVEAPYAKIWENTIERNDLECINPFQNIKTWFPVRANSEERTGSTPNTPDANDQPPNSVLISSSETQKSRPLLLFSRLKLTPLLSLARAGVTQSMVLGLLAERMAHAWEELVCDATEESSPIEINRKLFEKEHLRDIRISFLDLQEEEEIGILFNTVNYTVAMSMLVACQHLTAGDLWTFSKEHCRLLRQFKAPTYEHLAELVFDSHFHKSIKRKIHENYNGIDKEETEMSFLETVSDNHIFRWTRSTAAFALDLISGTPQQIYPKGIIAKQTGVGVMPGHQNEANEIAKQRRGIFPEGIDLYSLGSEDLPILLWEPVENSSNQVNSIKEEIWSRVLLKTEEAVKHFTCLANSANSNPGTPHNPIRHLTSWASKISIPVPASTVRGKDSYFRRKSALKQHFSITHSLLGKCRVRNSGISENFLNLEKLREETRRCGLPVPLRRSLMYLYENFINVLRNHHLFDTVLDFLDVMETLYHALTVVIPAKWANPDQGFADDYSCRVPLSVINNVSFCLEALDDAFELRLRRVFPAQPLRDWSLDFRSSLNQVILSAEAVLKCACAILRKDVLGYSNHGNNPNFQQDRTDMRRCLGALLHLRFHPGMTIRMLKDLHGDQFSNKPLGNTSVRPRLAIFEADFPHLSHIPGFTDFYHEAAHLIFEELNVPGPERGRRKSPPSMITPDLLSEKFGILNATQNQTTPLFTKTPDRITDSLGADRHRKYQQELFVQTFMLFFVFEGDWTQMLVDTLLAYSTNPSNFQKPANPVQSSFTCPNVKLSISSDPEYNPLRKEFAQNFFFVGIQSIWFNTADLGIEDQSARMQALLNFDPLCSNCDRTPISAISEQLVDKVEEFSQYYSEFPSYLGANSKLSEVSRNCLKAEFGLLLADLTPAMQEICSAVQSIYKSHINRIGREFSNQIPQDSIFAFDEYYETKSKQIKNDSLPQYENAYFQANKFVVDKIEACWGNPSSRLDGYAAVFGCDENLVNPISPQRAQDANLIVRKSILRYLKEFRPWLPTSKSKVRFLPRSPIHGKIDFDLSSGASVLNDHLIDRSTIRQFCCVPSERRHRLGCQIAVLKSFWDIASRNRARRFLRLVRLLNDE